MRSHRRRAAPRPARWESPRDTDRTKGDPRQGWTARIGQAARQRLPPSSASRWSGAASAPRQRLEWRCSPLSRASTTRPGDTRPWPISHPSNTKPEPWPTTTDPYPTTVHGSGATSPVRFDGGHSRHLAKAAPMLDAHPGRSASLGGHDGPKLIPCRGRCGMGHAVGHRIETSSGRGSGGVAFDVARERRHRSPGPRPAATPLRFIRRPC